MKFAIVAVFCLIAQALAYPTYDFEDTQEFDSAVDEANQEFVRVERNTYGHAGHGYGHQHVAPYGHQTHAYHAHAPKVECGHNVLVGCNPVVAKVCHEIFSKKLQKF